MQGECERLARFGAAAVGLLAAAALAVAVAPAPAQAGNLIVPQAAEPHHVEVHAQPPAAAPSPAPASSSSPAPSPPTPGRGNKPVSDMAEPEEGLPGADVPPGEGERPYPTNLPSPWGQGCQLNCLIHWHDWYFSRRMQVVDWDPEAAELLHQEQDAIDDMIRQEGGVPGSAATDEPTNEPTGPSEEEMTGHAPQLTNAATSNSDGGPGIAATVVDAISGVGQIVPENGPVDLGTVDFATPPRHLRRHDDVRQPHDHLQLEQRLSSERNDQLSEKGHRRQGPGLPPLTPRRGTAAFSVSNERGTCPMLKIVRSTVATVAPETG
jgi:hypothetical protein